MSLHVMQACVQITFAAAIGSSVSYSRVFRCNLRIRLDHEYGHGGVRPPHFVKADQVSLWALWTQMLHNSTSGTLAGYAAMLFVSKRSVIAGALTGHIVSCCCHA